MSTFDRSTSYSEVATYFSTDTDVPPMIPTHRAKTTLCIGFAYLKLTITEWAGDRNEVESQKGSWHGSFYFGIKPFTFISWAVN